MRRANSSGSTGHTVVVGAGPSGLSTAYELSRQGWPVTVIEKDDAVGGTGRTVEFMGCRFDLGPRPLVGRDAEVDALLRSVMGRELRPIARVSRGLYRGRFFNRPLRLSELLVKLGPVEGAHCLASFAKARLRLTGRPIDAGVEEPVEERTEGRIEDRIGGRAYDIFVGGRLRKIWGLTVREVDGGLECETLSAGGQLFRYPPRGAGQIWGALAGRIESDGSAVRLGEEVIAVRHGMGRVISVVVRDRRGAMMDVLASEFVSTMPVADLVDRLQPAPPSAVRAAAEALKYRDLVAVCVVVDRESVFPDQWIDVLDPTVRVARISNFRNFSRAMVPDSGLSGLALEYFCDGSDELSRMADRELLELARGELVALGLCRATEVKAGMVQRRRMAYRVPDPDGRAAVVSDWLERSLSNLWLVEGREEFQDGLGQVEAIRSGLAVAEGIAWRGREGLDSSEDGGSRRREGGEAEAMAAAGVGGYTEPAVPE